MNFLPLLLTTKEQHRRSLKTPSTEICLKEKSIIIVDEKRTRRRKQIFYKSTLKLQDTALYCLHTNMSQGTLKEHRMTVMSHYYCTAWMFLNSGNKCKTKKLNFMFKSATVLVASLDIKKKIPERRKESKENRSLCLFAAGC